MSEDEEPTGLLFVWGMFGYKVTNDFFPLTNFSFKIEHFVGNADIGEIMKHFYCLTNE